MLLQICDSMSVEEVEDRFHECFPFLLLAIYLKHANDSSDCRFEGLSRRRIGDIRQRHFNGILEIKSWQTPYWIQLQLKDVFDLHAHIYYLDKTGNPEIADAHLALSAMRHTLPVR